MTDSAPSSDAPSSNEVAKLRWRCRRGMRELDQILERFVDRSYAGLSHDERRSFAAILEYPDPDLYAYLVGNAEPMNTELARLFRQIRATVTA